MEDKNQLNIQNEEPSKVEDTKQDNIQNEEPSEVEDTKQDNIENEEPSKVEDTKQDISNEDLDLDLDFEDIDISLINPNPIINPERIVDNVRKYIDNYNSKEYKEYSIKIEELYRKLGKKYYIIHKDNSIYLMKNTVLGDTERLTDNINKNKITYVKKITKAKYINIETKLDELYQSVSSQKQKVNLMYNNLKKELLIRDIDKKKLLVNFENEKNILIELMEELETIKLYHISINKINMKIEKRDVIYQVKNEDGSLEGKSYKIDLDIINDINTLQGERLNLYNNIISELVKYIENPKELKKDNNLIGMMKEYIQNNDIDIINKKTLKIRNKQDNYIDFIVYELPKYE